MNRMSAVNAEPLLEGRERHSEFTKSGRGFLIAVLVLIRREISDKKLLFLGAAACAILALLSPLLPGSEAHEPLDVITTTSLALAFLGIVGTALILGLGIMSRDLGENRMSFYFSRPIPSWIIWISKVSSVFLISFAIGVILVAVPTAMGGGLFAAGETVADARIIGAWASYLFARPVTNLVILTSLVTALSLFFGLSFRARSMWFLLDALVIISIPTVVWISTRQFLLDGATTTTIRLIMISILAVIVILLVSNLVGTVRGRSDLLSTHRWSSVAASILSLLFLAGLGIQFNRLAGFSLTDAHYISLSSHSPQSRWVTFTASVEAPWVSEWQQGHQKTFLLDATSGREIELAHANDVAQAGSTVVYWERVGLSPAIATLQVVDLDQSSPAPRPTLMTADLQDTSRLTLDDTGERAAWISETSLIVYDLDTDRTIHTRPIDLKNRNLLWFHEDSLLIYRGDWGGSWTIDRLDLTTGTLNRTGTIEPGWLWRTEKELFFRPVTDERPSPIFEIHPLRGETSREITSPGSRFFEIISDGSVVAVKSGEPPSLVVKNSRGEETVLALPSGDVIPRYTSEPVEGQIALIYRTGEGTFDFETVIMDLNERATFSIGSGYLPLEVLDVSSAWPRPAPGSVTSRLFVSSEGLHLLSSQGRELSQILKAEMELR